MCQIWFLIEFYQLGMCYIWFFFLCMLFTCVVLLNLSSGYGGLILILYRSICFLHGHINELILMRFCNLSGKGTVQIFLMK